MWKAVRADEVPVRLSSASLAVEPLNVDDGDLTPLGSLSKSEAEANGGESSDCKGLHEEAT